MKKNARIMNKYLINIMIDFLCLSKVCLIYFPIFCSVGICKSVRNVHPCFRLIFFHCCTDPLLLFNALDQFVPQMLSLPFREIVVKEGNCKYMLFLFQVIFTKVQNIHPHTYIYFATNTNCWFVKR